MTRPTPDPLRAADTDLDDDMGDMCPNCITPWKCNGPHLVAETPYMRRLLAVRTGGGCLLVLLVAAASWWLR